MTTLEDRLRAAYTEAAATVRGLDELAVPRSPRTGRAPRRLARTLIPVTAAVAVAGIAVLVVIVPKVTSGPPAAARPWPGFVVTSTSTSATSLEVHDVTTGKLTGRIELPGHPGGQSPGSASASRAKVGAIATGNGSTFVVALYQQALCRSWLYQFRLDGRGRPSALIPFPALPSLRYLVTELGISANGSRLAFVTSTCRMDLGAPSYQVALGVTGTGQTRQWAIPASMRHDTISSLSLTANGGLLAFSDTHGVSRGAEFPRIDSYIRVMPTGAGPGKIGRAHV